MRRSTSGNTASRCSWVSTTSITRGRSSDSRRMFAGSEQLDERGGEGSHAGAVGLADEHAHQDLLAVDFSHGYTTRTPTISRPTAVPRKHTVRQSAVVARILIHARPHAPASMRRIVS